MQDRPTAAELLRAAQDFCEKDLQPALTGRLRFHVRVLQNVLAILEREWTDEEDALRAEWERLRTLLGERGLGERGERPDGLQALREQVRAWNTELAGRIRAGHYDERFDETVDALRATIADKLAIANPRYSVGRP